MNLKQMMSSRGMIADAAGFRPSMFVKVGDRKWRFAYKGFVIEIYKSDDVYKIILYKPNYGYVRDRQTNEDLKFNDMNDVCEFLNKNFNNLVYEGYSWVVKSSKPRSTVKAKPQPKTTSTPTRSSAEQFAETLKKERTLHLLEYDSAVDGADKIKPNLSGAEAAEMFLNARHPRNMYFFKDRRDFDLACELVDEICANYTGDPGQSYTVINRLGDDLYELQKKSLNFKG